MGSSFIGGLCQTSRYRDYLSKAGTVFLPHNPFMDAVFPEENEENGREWLVREFRELLGYTKVF